MRLGEQGGDSAALVSATRLGWAAAGAKRTGRLPAEGLFRVFKEEARCSDSEGREKQATPSHSPSFRLCRTLLKCRFSSYSGTARPAGENACYWSSRLYGPQEEEAHHSGLHGEPPGPVGRRGRGPWTRASAAVHTGGNDRGKVNRLWGIRAVPRCLVPGSGVMRTGRWVGLRVNGTCSESYAFSGSWLTLCLQSPQGLSCRGIGIKRHA